MSVEFLIKQDGAIYRRDVTEREIDLSERLVQSLTQNTIYKSNGIFNAKGYGPSVNLVSAGGINYFTIRLEKLNMFCPWHPLDEGVLVPNFSSKSDPVSKIPWFPPSGCRLVVLISTQWYEKTRCFAGMWLVAMDKVGTTWRLPLSNLHDDCAVCTGITNGLYTDNDRDLIDKVMETFENSKYNADLWKNSELTHRMFRIKPADKETFTTLPPDVTRDWTQLCLKVASAYSKFIML